MILSSRREEELIKVKALCGNTDNISILPLDLNNHKEMEILTQKAISFYGTIDILVNNAGISQRSLIKDTQLEVYEQLMDVNYLPICRQCVFGHIGLNKTRAHQGYLDTIFFMFHAHDIKKTMKRMFGPTVTRAIGRTKLSHETGNRNIVS